MKLHTINTGFFKLDGGAMFGVVPKSLWNKTNPADENNMCNWAMRCLLIEDSNRLILIDNGIGTKQDAKFFSYYFLSGNDTLENSIKQAGFSMDDVTDMFLTHLHFDHCGGSIKYSDDKSKLITAFKNAIYWSNAEHWEWATKPNAREKPSFLKDNILPISESGQLKFVNAERSNTAPTEEYLATEELGANISLLVTRGHTDAMMLPHISYKGRPVVFVADLIPSAGHIPISYVMGYDTRPLLTLTEKEKFLNRAVENDYVLFFEHDSMNECCTLQRTERGIRVKEVFKLEEL